MRATEGERRAAVAISAFGCHWRASAERTVDCSCGEVVASEIDAATVDIHDILVLRIELGRDAETVSKIDISLATELDWQLFNLQRKYLDYQVNVGNRIIAVLQSGEPDAAFKAQKLSEPKKMFQDMVDNLFKDTGKTIIRTANEIRFNQIGEQLSPYQLSAGEKQILAILLTVLVEDNQSYVLFMDEPEISLHFEWQKQLIGLVLKLNPNIQIIMTTHSPAVVMDGWTDRVTDVNDITIS